MRSGSHRWVGLADCTQGQSTFSSEQRQCVLNGFRKRAVSYRAKLRGDALSESDGLVPRSMQKFSGHLSHAYLDDDVDDGEFGLATRKAIKRFQAQSGFPEGEFLTAEQRQALLQTASPPAERVKPDVLRMKQKRDFSVSHQMPIAIYRLYENNRGEGVRFKEELLQVRSMVGAGPLMICNNMNVQ